MQRIGVLGGGQLGRMLALAGYPLGLHFRFLDPAPEAPAEQVAERVRGAYDDVEALRAFARGLSVATYEFENVPVAALEELARSVPVAPHARALAVGQDRLREKECFQSVGLDVPPFAGVDSREDLDRALARIGFPAVLKTRRLGYDGKGQAVLRSPADVATAWQQLGGQPLLLERFVDFEAELSILAVRSPHGEMRFYPLVENEHRGGILRRSQVPAPHADARLQQQAETYARAIGERLDYAGVFAIEFFLAGGVLLGNEMAPRVHNSGHWTIEGAVCSQFENHLRAILGWPLGSTDLVAPSILYNLIGNAPPSESLLEIPGLHLHLYGKSPRPARKIGHVTLVESDPERLREAERRLRALLAYETQ
jgi:5-(carboxyamino)imidazole ribonucleotide synthase